MRRRLVWVQYRKLLQTTLIGAVETVFAGIADTVLAGHLFGDDALAGVNLVAPAASLVLMFLGTDAYLVSNVMSSLRAKFNLVTMGENRSLFHFTEGSACAS